MKMLKHRVAVIFFASVFFWTLDANAATKLAASCLSGDVQNAINSAVNGDTINVPAGSCTWSSGITIHNKSISLIGGNGGTTTIALTGGRFLVLTRASGGQNASRVSAFTINQTSNLSTIHIDSDKGLSPQGFRIDHITRNVNGDAFIEFAEGWGNAASSWEGLIDNNIITNGRVQYWGEESSTGGRYRWSEPLNLGDEHALYIEDNTFKVTSPSRTGYVNQIDGGEGARTVARFNKFIGGRIESHGLQTDNSRSVKRWEFYMNTLTSSTTDKQYRPFLIRGGTGVVFGNTTDGNFSVQTIDIDNVRSSQSSVYPSLSWGKCDGTSWTDGNSSEGPGYPCRDQIGVGQDNTLWNYSKPASTQVKAPAYFWKNINTSNGSEINVFLQCPEGLGNDCANQSKQIVKNRDYFTYNSTFNGTSGVGQGPLANRPSTCTTGVGYWVTDQGEWNSKNSGNDGQLYKCTATNTWSLYYTPYPYPHPLTGQSVAPASILSPTNVRFE